MGGSSQGDAAAKNNATQVLLAAKKLKEVLAIARKTSLSRDSLIRMSKM